MLLYDLHSHTNASDGCLTPVELVERAVACQVQVLAITDHDTVAGLAAAHQVNQALGQPLTLINGVELSTHWHHYDIHVVGLNICPRHVELLSLLQSQQAQREVRARMIGERLTKAGIQGAYEGAQKLAQSSILSRAHFARWLINEGYASDMKRVFKRYLSRGKTGYVPNQWCSIEEAVTTIHSAGGQAVLAHPCRYQLNRKWLRRLLTHFKEVGGDAIEVIASQQSPQERLLLKQLAQEFGLYASLGSDFHSESPYIELGKNLIPDLDCQWIWQAPAWPV